MISSRGRRRLFALLVLIALIAGGTVGFMAIRGQSRAALLDDARKAGMAAYERGDYETALDRFSYVLSHDRDDFDVLVAFANARSRIPTINGTHVTEAIGLYQAALILQPNDANAQQRLLLLYERAGRRVEWVELADRILARDPDNIDALRLRAIGRYVDSRFEEAGEDMDQLIALQPDEMRWRKMRLQLLRDQNATLDELLARCDQWIADSEIDGRFHLLKAQTLASAGRHEAAREEAERAATVGAVSGDILLPMVSLLDVLQMRDTAAELLDTTVERFSNEPWPYEVAVRRLWQRNRLDAALERIGAVSEDAASLDRTLLRWKALLHVLREERDLAEEALDALTAKLPERSEAIRDADRAWIDAMRARLALSHTRWDDALQAYRTAIQTDPSDPVLNFLVAEAFMLAGETELAVISLERACQSDPNWIAAQVAYAEALLASGRAREAMHLTRDLLQQLEQPPLPLYILLARIGLQSNEPVEHLGIVDSRTGRTIGILEMLQRLYQLYPDDAGLRTVLCRAALWQGDMEIARAVIDDVLRDPEAEVETLLKLAEVSRTRDLDRSATLLNRARELHGLTHEIILAIARHRAASGREEDGLRFLEESLATLTTDGESINHQITRAEFLTEINHSEATDAWMTALQSPNRPARLPARILSLPLAWTSESLIRAALDEFAALVGERSPRAAMAEVRFILTFKSNDRAARARAHVLVNDVLQQTPDSLPALSLMARLYLLGETPDYEGAISQLRRAIGYHPNEPELYVRLIRLLQESGQFSVAEDYLQRLAELVGNDPALRRTELKLLERQGDVTRIVDRLTEDGAPDSAMDELYLISQLHRAGRSDEAIARLDDLLAGDNPSELAVRTTARIYADVGRFDDGLNLLQTHLASHEPATRQVVIGEYLQSSGRTAAARDAFEAALKHDPDQIAAIVQLAGLHLAEGRPTEAFNLAERGLHIEPANELLQTTLLSSGLLLDESHRQRVRELLAERSDDDGAGIATLRLFEQAQRSGSPTHEHLQQAQILTQRYPEFLPAWRLAVILHVQADQIDQAIRIATEASARLPARPEPAEITANLLAREGRFIDALQMARTWRERSLDRTLPVDAFLASLHLALNEPNAAAGQIRPHAEIILAERDHQPGRASVLMRSLLAVGDVAVAANLFRPALHDDERWRSLWMETAVTLDREPGRAALEAIEPIVADDPQSALALASAWSTFGHRRGDDGAFDRAETLARQAATDDPELATQSLLLRAQAADWRGDLSHAETLYRAGLSADRNNILTLNNLAYVLIRRDTKCEEAAQLIAEARSAAPDVPELMDTQAHALLCLDRNQEAEQTARQALERRPDSPDFLFTLGLALSAQGRWSEAAEILERIDAILAQRPQAGRPLREKVERLRQSVETQHVLSQTPIEDSTIIAP